ncbi:hypothetical protein MNBD_NITROSPINAE04-1379 [hydrothermal vent metagenome]|uniref:Phosphatidic acid phosphatase type 2/haloperoxidase domain-containing protein n=1 Tax=hydrothermal vent metagenome TaxID=652676 RepID=A0A3B1CDD4_9ZZZZ
MISALVGIDESFFLWINNGLSSVFADTLMILATMAGDSIVLILGGLYYILTRAEKNRRRRLALTFLITMAVAGASLQAVKHVAPRDRPLKHFQQETKSGKAVVNTPLNLLYNRSFPSGHSQAAFTTAMFFALYIRRRRALLFLAASLVALSRVYLGVHFLSDAIAGSIMGAFIAWIIYRIDPQSPCARAGPTPGAGID